MVKYNIQKNVYLLYILHFVIISISFIINDLAFCFFYVFFIFVGFIFVHNILPRKLLDSGKFLFLLFYLIYFLYTLLTHLSTVENPFKDYFIASDQSSLYEWVYYLGHFSRKEIWTAPFTEYKYFDLPLFIAFSSSIQLISNYLGTGSLLIQKLQVVFFSSIIPIFLYGILIKYFDKYQSFKFSLVYGIFSFLLFFSSLFLRDVHIAFIYIWMFYILSNRKHKVGSFIVLLVLVLVTFFLRFESGVFSFVILIVYFVPLLEGMVKNRFIALILVGLFLILILIYTDLLGLVNHSIETISRYTQGSIDKSTANSLSLKLEALPLGINYIAKTAFGQIQPFPIWSYWGLGEDQNRHWLSFPLSIGGVFWFFNWVFILWGLSHKDIRDNLKPEIKHLVFIALLLIILMSIGEWNTRRMMSVYPILYIVSCHTINNLNGTKIKELIFKGGLLLIVLHLFYIFLKI